MRSLLQKEVPGQCDGDGESSQADENVVGGGDKVIVLDDLSGDTLGLLLDYLYSGVQPLHLNLIFLLYRLLLA